MSGPRDQEELPGYDFNAERIRMLKDRIEALEAALRYTAGTAAGELNYTGQSRSTRAALQKINVMARAALAPEQDK